LFDCGDKEVGAASDDAISYIGGVEQSVQSFQSRGSPDRQTNVGGPLCQGHFSSSVVASVGCQQYEIENSVMVFVISERRWSVSLWVNGGSTSVEDLQGPSSGYFV
jgi:hypothetical protein